MHGDGVAWYVSAALAADGLVAVMRRALADARLPARDRLDPDVEAVTRSSDDVDYTFVLNHGAREAVVGVPDGAEDLLGGGRT